MNRLSSRRNALKIGLLTGLSTWGLAACDMFNDVNDTEEKANVNSPTTLRLLFWGTTTRDMLTQNALHWYHHMYTGTTITSNYTTFAAYWSTLDRLIATGHTPDLFQMDMRYLAQYVKGERMLDLTQLIYNQTIDLSDFDPLLLAGSKANNALYGIPLGGNYQCLLYNTVLLEKANVGALPNELSWEMFAAYMQEIGRALGKGIYGVGDASVDLAVYEIWIRQRGKELYTVDGRLGFTVEDIVEWFVYWEKLRANGGCVPPDLPSALLNGGGAIGSTLVRGTSVFVIPHSNELESFQALISQRLAMHDMPTGAQAGLYLKPSLLLSISAQTPYIVSAANFINFLVNDPKGIKAIGIERGVPGSPRAQTLLRTSFTPAEQQEVAFVDAISQSDKVRLKEVLDPPAASQVAMLFQQVALQVAKKQSTAHDGAKAFLVAAENALR